jgi:hypothetical protein
MSTARDGSKAKRFRSIIARSKPACHICGLPINYTLPYLDPMAFVIDHVIPLHKGGEDALPNIRAAHRRQPLMQQQEARTHRCSDHPQKRVPRLSINTSTTSSLST